MRTAFEKARAALDWEFESVDWKRAGERKLGGYGLYRQLADDRWLAQKLGVYDGPDLSILLRRLHCRTDRFQAHNPPLQRYFNIRDHYEELYDFGEIEEFVFVATRYVAGASVARVGRTMGRLSWAASLALCCLGLESLDRIHRAGFCYEREPSSNLRLWLGKREPLPLVVLCGAYPLCVRDDQLIIVDQSPNRETERWQMVLSLLSLAGLQPIERSKELLNGSPESRLVLADIVLEQLPSPYDEALVYLVEGDGADHTKWVTELERWLGERLDPVEVQRIWQAAADHDLSLRADPRFRRGPA